MAMEAPANKRYCCDCVHYIPGNMEDPCARGNRKCGYLYEGCWQWKSNQNEDIETPTKKCIICNETLTIDKFYKSSKTADGYTDTCRNCFSHKDRIKEVKERAKQNAWTESEDKILMEMFPDTHNKIADIAKRLDRNVYAVNKRAYMLGLKRKGRAK